MEFSERLKSLMKESGLSNIELERRSGVANSRISSCVNGNSKDGPTLKTLGKLAGYFGVSIDYLVGRTDVRNVLQKTEEDIVMSQNEGIAHSLSRDESDVVKYFKLLTDDEKITLIGALRYSVESKQPMAYWKGDNDSNTKRLLFAFLCLPKKSQSDVLTMVEALAEDVKKEKAPASSDAKAM